MMFLQRTLLRLFKLLLYTLFVWISVLVLYLALPSPAPNDASINASLQSGRTVTRAFHRPFLPTQAFPIANTRESVIIEFKLVHEASSGSLSLLFGGGYDLLDTVGDKIDAFFFDRRLSPSIPIPYSNVSLDVFDSETTQISPVITLSIPTAYMDGPVPPYIATADAALLNWWMRHDTETIPFQVKKLPKERLIEVWSNSSYSDHDETETPSESQSPLLSVKLDKSSNLPNFLFHPSSSSPSVTYLLRLSAFLFLLPIAAIAMLLFSVFSGIFHGILELVYLALNIAALGVVCVAVYGIYWWIKNERPRMSVSFTDVREVLDSTLDNVRTRSEARGQEGIDLEAQNREGDPVSDQAASSPGDSVKLKT